MYTRNIYAWIVCTLQDILMQKQERFSTYYVPVRKKELKGPATISWTVDYLQLQYSRQKGSWQTKTDGKTGPKKHHSPCQVRFAEVKTIIKDKKKKICNQLEQPMSRM